MKNNLISVIIANFNGEKYLDNCLNSVLNSDYKKFEVIVIDDGSTDKSLEILRKFKKHYSKVKVLRNLQNHGAAASRNKAITKTKGSIIVFLDNDVEVTPIWLSELSKSLKKKDIGAAQSLLIDYIKRDTIQMAGGKLIQSVIWLDPFLQGRSYKRIKNQLIDRDIVAVSAALAVKREVLDIVGGFDDQERVYTEDLDLCWRIWISGFRVVLSSKSIVYHYSKTIDQRQHMKVNNLQIYYQMSKNSMRSIIKNYELKNMPVNLFLFLVINVIGSLWIFIKRGKIAILMGAVLGIGWNLININDTLKSRVMIQKTRQFSDQYLFSKMFNSNSLIRLIDNYLLGVYRIMPFTYINMVRSSFKETLKEGKKISLLDLGCGDGLATQRLYLPGNFEITGLDIFKPYLELAEEKGIYSKLIKGDINNFRPKRKFDIVLVAHVLEHIDKNNGVKFLAGLEKIARRKIIIITPIGPYPQEMYDGNKYQKHRSSWYVDEMIKQGYKIKPHGLKFLWGNNNIVQKYGLFSYFLFAVSDLLYPVLLIKPEWGTYMICVKTND